MKYLTEAEFDRLVMSRKAVARMYLRRAAEEDDVCEAKKYTSAAMRVFGRIPKKEWCRKDGCRHCGCLSCKRDIHRMTDLGRLFIVPGPMFCASCKEMWETHTRFHVHDHLMLGKV